jgi:hypothetical protein
MQTLLQKGVHINVWVLSQKDNKVMNTAALFKNLQVHFDEVP